MVVASTNQEVEQQYQVYEHYVPDRMEVIPPGVDLTAFHPPAADDRPPAFLKELRRFLTDPDKPFILTMARPDERNPKRLERPQTEWDVLHGLLTEYQRGDVPVARAYLNRHADGRQETILDLLHVWAEEMPDEKRRKEAQTLLFGLRSAQPA